MRGTLGATARSEHGFTLVELLAAMLILGILAAIAVPAFFSQRDKARDAEAKVQVQTAETAIEVYASDRNGSYTGATVSALQQIEPVLRDVPAGDLTVQVMGASGKYRVAVLAPTGNEYSIRREADDSLSYPCDTAGKLGCPASGAWG
jgi:prepilin-type N-terminal cleavage/methylation domain-containing protein